MPTHEHDCDACKFVETYELLGQDGMTVHTVDLYYCGSRTSGLGSSIIQRFSSDGPDYWSMPASLVPDPDLKARYWGDIAEERRPHIEAYFKALYTKAHEAIAKMNEESL